MGGTVYFPSGIYLVSKQINLKSGRYIGDGPYSTYIKTTSTSAGIFFDGGNFGVTIDGMGFTASTQNIAGSFITFSGSQCNLKDFRMELYFNGITHSGSTSVITNGYMGGSTSTSVSNVGVVLAGLDILLENVVMDGGKGSSRPEAGIQIAGPGGGVFISHCDIVDQKHGVLINESISANVLAPYFDNCYFDSSTANAVNISPGAQPTFFSCILMRVGLHRLVASGWC